jgi:histidine triad (HIT) family protein
MCKIVDGRVESRKVFENEMAVVVLDKFPVAKGHCLIIPKEHHEKIQSISPDTSYAMMDMVRKLSTVLETALEVEGTLTAIHNGKTAGQEIAHSHIHVIPRSEQDGAGPVHDMFNARPSLSVDEMDYVLREIKKVQA